MDDAELARSIGQLLCVGFYGSSPEEENVRQLIQHIQDGLVGSVILFRHNIIDSAQIANLTHSIANASPGLPVFIMVDQEGGRVQRLTSSQGFTDFNSAKFIAEHNSERQAQDIYYSLGSELASVGINFNFAPSVDVDFLPACPVIGALERSFSSDPMIVANYGARCVDGLRLAGILSCLKHFPGHGSAQCDSHKGFTDVTQVWSEVELEPFRKLISDDKADAVMMAHIVHHTIDPDVPASLSKAWVNRLRHDLHFNGVVVSDDMHMGAIQKYFDMTTLVKKALNAGVDLMVFSNNPQAAQGVIGFQPDSQLPIKFRNTVLELLDEGFIVADELRQSLNRIAMLKARLKPVKTNQ